MTRQNEDLLISNESDAKFQIESLLEYALKNAKNALNYHIEYIEHIENEIKKFPSSKLEEFYPGNHVRLNRMDEDEKKRNLRD